MWGIARAHGVTADHLRSFNSLRGSRIYGGRTHQIPPQGIGRNGGRYIPWCRLGRGGAPSGTYGVLSGDDIGTRPVLP